MNRRNPVPNSNRFTVKPAKRVVCQPQAKTFQYSNLRHTVYLRILHETHNVMSNIPTSLGWINPEAFLGPSKLPRVQECVRYLDNIVIRTNPCVEISLRITEISLSNNSLAGFESQTTGQFFI